MDAKTIFVHLAEGFEEIEAVTIVDVLRRAGLNTVTVAIGESLEVIGAHKIIMQADQRFEEIDYSQGRMIVLPGGGLGTRNLTLHQGLTGKLKEYAEKGKYIAAICAAPSVLGKHGLLEGKKAVCYPGFEEELIGASVQGDPVLVDGSLITSRGPGTALDFSLRLVEILAGKAKAEEVAQGMLAC